MFSISKKEVFSISKEAVRGFWGSAANKPLLGGTVRPVKGLVMRNS